MLSRCCETEQGTREPSRVLHSRKSKFSQHHRLQKVVPSRRCNRQLLSSRRSRIQSTFLSTIRQLHTERQWQLPPDIRAAICYLQECCRSEQGCYSVH